MRSRTLGSFREWDELELLEAEAGRHLRGRDPSREDLASASRIFASIPRMKVVEVTADHDWFCVAPGPEQPTTQLALAGLLRTIRGVGWRVSNIRRRFNPPLAVHVARRFGWHTLGWRNSWIKLMAPNAMVVEARLQRYPASVDNMLDALADQEPVMDIAVFTSLSVTSLSRAMPYDEARDYFVAMR